MKFFISVHPGARVPNLGSLQSVEIVTRGGTTNFDGLLSVHVLSERFSEFPAVLRALDWSEKTGESVGHCHYSSSLAGLPVPGKFVPAPNFLFRHNLRYLINRVNSNKPLVPRLNVLDLNLVQELEAQRTGLSSHFVALLDYLDSNSNTPLVGPAGIPSDIRPRNLFVLPPKEATELKHILQLAIAWMVDEVWFEELQEREPAYILERVTSLYFSVLVDSAGAREAAIVYFGDKANQLMHSKWTGGWARAFRWARAMISRVDQVNASDGVR